MHADGCQISENSRLDTSQPNAAAGKLLAAVKTAERHKKLVAIGHAKANAVVKKAPDRFGVLQLGLIVF